MLGATMRDAGNKNDSHRVHWMACLLCNGRDVRVLCCGWWQYLRMHSTRSEKGERRIWTFPPKIFEAARAAFHLRYSLLSYIYTSARQAYDSAVPLNRYDRVPSTKPRLFASLECVACGCAWQATVLLLAGAARGVQLPRLLPVR